MTVVQHLRNQSHQDSGEMQTCPIPELLSTQAPRRTPQKDCESLESFTKGLCMIEKRGNQRLGLP